LSAREREPNRYTAIVQGTLTSEPSPVFELRRAFLQLMLASNAVPAVNPFMVMAHAAVT
jgi:hypothetical protein